MLAAMIALGYVCRQRDMGRMQRLRLLRWLRYLGCLLACVLLTKIFWTVGDSGQMPAELLNETCCCQGLFSWVLFVCGDAESLMKYSVKSVVAAGLVWSAMSIHAPQAEAAPVCEAAPEATCCEAAAEPVCDAAPAPYCASNFPLPELAEGEVLISISPIKVPKSVIASSSEPTQVAMRTS